MDQQLTQSISYSVCQNGNYLQTKTNFVTLTAMKSNAPSAE